MYEWGFRKKGVRQSHDTMVKSNLAVFGRGLSIPLLSYFSLYIYFTHIFQELYLQTSRLMTYSQSESSFSTT